MMLGRYLEKRIPAQIKPIVPHQSLGGAMQKSHEKTIGKKDDDPNPCNIFIDEIKKDMFAFFFRNTSMSIKNSKGFLYQQAHQ